VINFSLLSLVPWFLLGFKILFFRWLNFEKQKGKVDCIFLFFVQKANRVCERRFISRL
jgi:hypothetical protein